jgi:integrase
MSIKNDPKHPGHYIVAFSKRHPVTAHAVTLRRKGVATLAEAKRLERELILQVEERCKRAVVPILQEAIVCFLEQGRAEGLTLKTLDNYRACLEKHAEPWLRRGVDEITPMEIRELINVRMVGYSVLHRKSLLKHLRGVFGHLVERNILTRSPVPALKFKDVEKIKGVLTTEQVRKLLETARQLEDFWYPHWSLALYTGMRNGELYALRWDKVNLVDRKILVDLAWNSKDGFKSTKSRSDRIIPISPELMHVLKELKLKTLATGYVLPRSSVWDKGEQARELRRFLTGLGMPAVKFHDLRATWATLLLSKGIAPIKVMQAGGWRDLKTMQIYVRKAGVDVAGITDTLCLHDPHAKPGQVVSLNFGTHT